MVCALSEEGVGLILLFVSFLGPYGVRIDNLLSISRSFVGGGSVPRSESPDGAGFYRTAPRGPLSGRRPGKV